MRRRRGGQPGNRNGYKHGVYSSVLSQEETVALRQVDSIQGIDPEIAILRLKIRQILERDPDNTDLYLRATDTLGRLFRFKKHLNPRQAQGLNQSDADVLREIALPLGLNLSPPGPERRSRRQSASGGPLVPPEVENSPDEKEIGQG